MPRQHAPDSRPVALTIAGSDSGGGAGVQADVQTMAAHGAFATSVVTAVTAQNTVGVESTHVLPPGEVAAQFDAVAGDFDVAAAKTGMLATAPLVELVADRVADLDAPVVVDPVMVAASGDRLLAPEAEDAYRELVAEATLVTPNTDEAAVLTGVDPVDVESSAAAGDALVETGATAALVTGGHVDGDAVRDVLVTGDGRCVFEHPRVDTDATHGSGCTLSSAAAARLARGDSLVEAVESATEFLERAVRYACDVGAGPGAVNHLAALRERADARPTLEAVESVVDRLVAADVSALVPEVGTNVVGATAYAERPAEMAAVEGRVTRTRSGVRPNRGVRFGASSHVARFLLAAREFDPSLRFAANCRFGEDVEAAFDSFDWRVAEYDRSAQPDAVREREEHTMGWGARRAFEATDGTAAAVFDRGAVGKEPMVRLLASESDELADRLITLAQAVDAA